MYIDLNCNITFAFNLRNNFNFIHALDNLCENALDLRNGKLIVENNWPAGTNCQWLISAVDDEHYVNLEFANLGVRIAELNLVYLILHFFIYLDHILA